MIVILLAGYKTAHGQNAALVQSEGELLLDRQIAFWISNKCEVAVVLAGSDADDALRVSRLLPQCDLVFDTHADANVWTNLQSGLFLPQNDCWATTLDAKIDLADLQRWTAATFPLRNKAHIFQNQAEWPVFIPKPAHKYLTQLEGIRSLTDPKITLVNTVDFALSSEAQKLYKQV